MSGYMRLRMRREQGAALFVSLIILLLMTMIGVTAMQTTTLQERMAGSTRDLNLAFQAAEAALREAEDFLDAASLPDFNGTNGLYRFDPVASDPSTSVPVWKKSDWSWSNAREYQGTLSDLHAKPRYVIEELPAAHGMGESIAADEPLLDSGMYRVTARAVGGSGSSAAILQSTYKR
jgi:type IV pilus assembly protein PilX